MTKIDFSLILDPSSVNRPRKSCAPHLRNGCEILYYNIDSMGTWKRTAHARKNGCFELHSQLAGQRYADF